MKPKSYRVMFDRVLQEEVVAKKNDIVYDCMKYDYGLSNDDTRFLGVHHVSVTFNEDGDYPCFTIPYAQLEPIG